MPGSQRDEAVVVAPGAGVRTGNEDDAFYVLEGEITFLLGGDEIAGPAGTFVLVPPGVEHTFANRTSEPARILSIHAPAKFDRRLLGE